MPLPAIVIAELLGVPRSDRVLFQRWSNELAGIVFAASFRAADDVAALAGASSFATYFGDLVQHISLAPDRAGQRAADATYRRIWCDPQPAARAVERVGPARTRAL